MPGSKKEKRRETRYDIFLSYDRDDKEKATKVFEMIGLQGWSVFMDKEIPIAERWEQHLKRQLAKVPCVLVLWSAKANESEWVKKEADRAKRRHVLIHSSLDGLLPPGELSKMQCNDLSGWDGTSDHPEFKKLLLAVAQKIGTKGALGTIPLPEPYEKITEDHLALTSTSWKREGVSEQEPFKYMIHLRLVGRKVTMQRVENVVYYFDPAYGTNRPDSIDPVLKAYVKVSSDWKSGFTVYEWANGFSIVRAAVKVKDQSEIIWLSRLVDIMEKGPWLKDLYHTWSDEK